MLMEWGRCEETPMNKKTSDRHLSPYPPPWYRHADIATRLTMFLAATQTRTAAGIPRSLQRTETLHRVTA
eukprot:1412733-Rhodomonas_salina.2